MYKNKVAKWKGRKILSNLSFDEFNKHEIKELYKNRRSIETSYNCIKSKLKIEAFTGNLPIIIRQDIYAQILVYNQLQDMIFTGNK